MRRFGKNGQLAKAYYLEGQGSPAGRGDERLLELAHDSHFGIFKMKERLQSDY